MHLSSPHLLRWCARPSTTGQTLKQPAVQSTRRDTLFSVAGLSIMAVVKTETAVATEKSSSNSSVSGLATDPGSFINITPINNDAKDFMDRRDDAMEYKCKGGMFDCDGDRREFAKKQYQDWLDAGGVPKRIREGRPDGPRAF